MTPAILKFLEQVGPQGRVLEIGSFNVNGSAREVIPAQEWVGTDMRAGPGVDMQIDAINLHAFFPPESFDCVVCAETLEHCEDWKEVLRQAWAVLKTGGVMAITAPAPGVPRHDYPDDYQRFTAAIWRAVFVFSGQDVIACDEWQEYGPTSGVIVRKRTGQLDLDNIQAEPIIQHDHIVIATPFYENKGYSPYIVALTQTIAMLDNLKVSWEYLDLSGDSYIDRARNTICGRFLRGMGTHLVFIDSDMAWSPDGFLRLITSDERIIGGSYPQKNNWNLWACIPHTDEQGNVSGKLLAENRAIIRAKCVSAGFMMVRREVLEKFRKHYPELRYHDPSADPTAKDYEHTAYFECFREHGARFGEDYTFSRRCEAMGETLWIEPNIEFGHHGINAWYGNYDTYLRELPKK